MNNLCTFSNLQQKLYFDQFESSLVESIQTLATTKPISKAPKQSAYRWYYRDNEDEFEMYGFDETNELEKNWKNYLSGNGDQIQAATTGYFANCYDKHCIDFSQFTQYNVDSKESRQIIRAVSNQDLNNNFLQINCTKAINVKKTSCVGSTCVHSEKMNTLRTDLFKQEARGGDAVTINIAAYANNIIYNTLYAQYKNNDIPIATYIINKSTHKNVDNLLNTFINYQQNMDIVKLYNVQCEQNKKIKVNSSMISYLISQQKCNFILYDTDFQLLAVGKYNASYIYNHNDKNINPYRYQSFIEFHNLLTSFYQISLKSDVEIASVTSCFNKNIRSFLAYDADKKCALWTPAIDNKQIFAQILSNKILINGEYDNDEERESNFDDGYDSAIESTETERKSMCDTLECSVCYENIILNECDVNSNVNHKDLCHSCLKQWKESGHDTCPKCGVSHVNAMQRQ